MNSPKAAWSALPVGLLLVATLAHYGCGSADDGGSSAGVPSVQFLELSTPGSEEGEAFTPTIVAKLTTEKPTQWTIEGAEHRVVEAKKPEQNRPPSAVVMTEPEAKCFVRIPGSFDPQSFNFMALHFRAASKWELSVDFYTGGKRVSLTAPQVVTPEAGKDVRTVLVEAPHIRRLEKTIDEIVIKITGVKHNIWIAGLDLLWQPDHEFLPAASKGAKPVLVGRESRNGVGVSKTRPLTSSFEAEEKAMLRFSYATPGELTRVGSEARLELRLSADGNELHKSHYPLDSNFRKARWRQALIPLAEFAGKSLEAEWTVQAKGDEAVAVLAEATVVRPGSTNRRVLLITSDTHRGDHMGLADEGVDVDTPMLDALASRGVFFEDCFSTTNITNPSHISMMTGVHPRDTGIVNNYTRVAEAAPTLAEAFRDAGYITYASVSTRHLSDPTSGLGQGFERASYPLRDFARDGSETIEILDEWIEESEGLPVFVWLHLFDAHMPYDKDVPKLGRYYGDKGEAFDDSLPELGSAVQKAINNLRLPGLRDLEFPRALYKAEITKLDEQLGDFLNRPFFEGSVIAFTADHGESLGNHDIYFAHEELYRESLHVPLILCWPDGPAGIRFPSPVSNVNVGRTLLDLSGNLSIEFPGDNLALRIEDEELEEERFSLSAHGREVSLTDEGWHFQLRLGKNDLADGSSTRAMHQAELYFLPDDPHCAKDLLDAEFARAKEMRAKCLRWLREQRDLNWIGGDSGDAETMKKLTALGYTDGGSAGASASLAVDPDCDCEWCARFE